MTYQIGQVVQGIDFDARAIFTPSKARWHALIVPVMKEASAEAWLKRRGVYSFHPVKKRRKVIKGRHIEHKTRYLPGYVFAQFPGIAIPNRILRCPFISDAIRLGSNEWAILSPHDLRGIHAMRDADEQEQQARESAQRIRPGDRVRVLGGLEAVDGQEVEVVSLSTSGRVKFTIHMFGAEIRGEATLDQIQKLA